MYYFPNLNEQTRLIMISELESDLNSKNYIWNRTMQRNSKKDVSWPSK